MKQVPEERIRLCRGQDANPNGDYVVYWMIAARRKRYNFGLQRAVEWARELEKPLVVLEALRCDYEWASDRLHHFVLQGMADNAEAFQDQPVLYHPYVEPEQGAGKGLLAALTKRASVLVTDDFPAFFLPRMVAAAADRLDVRLEAVDSNGLLPLAASDRAYPTAYAFRRHLQKTLPPHLDEGPKVNPLARISLPTLESLPRKIRARWPATTIEDLRDASWLADLPIDHAVHPTEVAGGSTAARKQMRRFLDRLEDYAELRNEPSQRATSGLSPYLHFGHVSAHEVFTEVAKREDWDPGCLGTQTRGKREGWWGMSPAAEAFLDELVTWREVGYHFCRHRSDYARFESLPDWVRQTLAKHAHDEREYCYSLARFERAQTHDPLWNAAQRQLVREGTIHNYLRMLWGKKILEWSATPRDALEVMIELNNKYALDGRNPNSYSGIFWVLGRFDRPWGPERPIFGTVRYMSSQNTARKVKTKEYVQQFDEGAA